VPHRGFHGGSLDGSHTAWRQASVGGSFDAVTITMQHRVRYRDVNMVLVMLARACKAWMGFEVSLEPRDGGAG
jgi:hypothetical protein